MLKKKALRKILITTLTIVIILMVYMMPSNNAKSANKLNVNKSVEYKNVITSNIYLLDNNDLLVRVNSLVTDTDNVEIIIKDIINNLLNNTLIPNKLKSIMPKNTKLLQMTYENNELCLNFSQELLNVDEKYQVKLIESIAYSLFEIDEIKSIRIYVKDINVKDYFKDVDEIITRDFGINKKFNITSFKDVQKVVTYYITKIDNNNYYVPITNYVNNDKDKIKIIVENLSSNYIYEPNLISYLNSKTELINYEINEDTMTLNFNNSIFINENKILEEVIYTLSYSVFDSYKINKLIINVNDNIVKEVSK